MLGRCLLWFRLSRVGTFSLFLAAALMVGACGGRQLARYSAAELRRELMRRAPDTPPDLLVVPFEVDKGQVAFASRWLRPISSQGRRAYHLLQMLRADGPLSLAYSVSSTAVAAETLRQGEGNCLSIASAVVGLGRAVGLNAFYVDMSARNHEVREMPGLVVSAGHVGAAIFTPQGKYVGLDFSEHPFVRTQFRPIDDITATAMFHTNLGFELITQAEEVGDVVPWSRVREHFELAAKVQPRRSDAWSNLGVAQARLGLLDDAAESYGRAIALGPGRAAPYGNLAALHRRRGDLAAALTALYRAVAVEPRRADLAYRLGVVLLRLGKRQEAEQVLERADRMWPGSNRAGRLLQAVRSSRGGVTNVAP